MVQGDPVEESDVRRATVLVVEDEVLLRLAIAEARSSRLPTPTTRSPF